MAMIVAACCLYARVESVSELILGQAQMAVGFGWRLSVLLSPRIVFYAACAPCRGERYDGHPGTVETAVQSSEIATLDAFEHIAHLSF